MYLNTGNKAECCGCTACQQICGHNAIEMKADSDGFVFPVKDNSACVNCGLCEKVCSFATPVYNNETLGVYAAMAKNPHERSKSSSGALFYVIAKKVIQQGGIVYGAILDKNLQVRHAPASSIEELSLLRGSKYVQSALHETYREIRTNLRNGRLVYFTGTSCQVAGLKSFLMKDYDNLITSDLVCHGVPNQKLFNEHISYLEHKHKGKVVDYQFRDNTKWGGCETVTIAKDSTRPRTFRLPTYNLSPYLYSFMYGITSRMSCYECPFAKIPRQGDITLADYWGVQKYFPNLDISRGVSLILANNNKGISFLDKLKTELIFEESNINDASKENRNLTTNTSMPEIRNTIFKKIQDEGYEKVAKTIFRPKNYYKILLMAKLRGIVGMDNYLKLRKLIKRF